MSETTSFSPPAPSQQQKQTDHSKHNECLPSSDEGVCHDQKAELIQNIQYAPKQKSGCVNSQTQTL